MERTLIDWIKLGFRIRELTEQIDRLKHARGELESQLIGHVTQDNQERRVIGKYEVWVAYRRRYQFDLPVIRTILEPRHLFDEISTVRIKQEQLTSVIATPGLLTEAEFEDILAAIHIATVKEVLRVRRNRSGRIS